MRVDSNLQHIVRQNQFFIVMATASVSHGCGLVESFGWVLSAVDEAPLSPTPFSTGPLPFPPRVVLPSSRDILSCCFDDEGNGREALARLLPARPARLLLVRRRRGFCDAAAALSAEDTISIAHKYTYTSSPSKLHRFHS